MPDARDILGTVYQGGTLTLLARVVGSDGAALTRAVLSAARYSAYRLDPGDPASRTVVTGHSAVAVAVSSLIYDTLQTDAIWTEDATGYNFRHELSIASNAVFAAAGTKVLVEFTLTPTSGQPILVRFRLTVI